MQFTIGFSPCPNDTFIFDALVNKRIDTGGIDCIPILEDVQTLNEWALAGKLAVTKISYGVLPLIAAHYQVLESGSALGRGVGPLLITRDQDFDGRVQDQAVAIPGENTTAHLLFSLAYPDATHKVFLRYDEIESFVKAGKGLGVIIHENRFTYASKGLYRIKDLGEHWEQTTGGPIPLGGIVISRSMPDKLKQRINGLIQQSLLYARAQYPALSAYIRCHAQEMEDHVMRQHIDLYVNDYTLSLGDDGRAAILRLMEVASGLRSGNARLPADLFASQ